MPHTADYIARTVAREAITAARHARARGDHSLADTLTARAAALTGAPAPAPSPSTLGISRLRPGQGGGATLH